MSIDLDAIRERLEAATPGPWTTGGIFDPRGPNPKQSVWGPTAPGMQSGVLVVDRAPKADATLIAHAPADIAALLAEVERLRALAGRLLVEFTGDTAAGWAKEGADHAAFLRAENRSGGFVACPDCGRGSFVDGEADIDLSPRRCFSCETAAVTAERDRLRDTLDCETGRRAPEGWTWDAASARWERTWDRLRAYVYPRGRLQRSGPAAFWELHEPWGRDVGEGSAPWALQATEAADIAAMADRAAGGGA